MNGTHLLGDPVQTAQLLRYARLLQDLKQADVASVLGTTQSAVSQWEATGRLRLSSFLPWAGCLGFSVLLVPMAEGENLWSPRN